MLQPLYNLFATVIEWINGFLGNYAWSIIVMTLLLRMLMVPSDFKQKRSLRKQRAIAPKLEALQKKYGNDKEKYAQKQMELYKQENISPFSGCLPLLLTIPIFIAFFGALRMIAANHLVELYEAMQHIDPADTQAMDGLVTKWLWVQNIWQPDAFTLRDFTISNVIPTMNDALIKQYAKVSSLFAESGITTAGFNEVMAPLRDYFAQKRLGFNGFFILPLLAGGTSLLHSKLTMNNQMQPTPGQENNPLNTGKIMQYMFPLMSLYFCATSNAVFAIYWLTSNLVALASHFIINGILDRQEAQAALSPKNNAAPQNGAIL